MTVDLCVRIYTLPLTAELMCRPRMYKRLVEGAAGGCKAIDMNRTLNVMRDVMYTPLNVHIIK